jgi:hypothetical protein
MNKADYFEAFSNFCVSLRKTEKLRAEEEGGEEEGGEMQRQQLMKMHKQLMEAVDYLEGVEFEDWVKDMISKAELYIQNIYDFIEANSPKEQSEANKKG